MLTFDGLDLYVRTYGRADAPVTVVLAHCWTADTELWHYQVRDLLAEFGHDVQLITWDHRGHGRSAPATLAACTVTNLATDMAQVIDTHAPNGQLILAGHSIGGMTMMALAEQRPDLIARAAGALFIATSAGDLRTVTLGLPELGPAAKAQLPRLLGMRARQLARGHSLMPASERRVARQLLFGLNPRARDAGLVIDQMLASPPATMEGFLRDMMNNHNRLDALKTFTGVPTAVMVGDRDQLTPHRHSRAIAGAVRGARLLIYPGAGHMLPLEREEAVSGQLIAMTHQALRAGALSARR